MSDKPEGWSKPSNSHKWHYFIDKTSLCGRFMYIKAMNTDYERGHDSSNENCAACKRKLLVQSVMP